MGLTTLPTKTVGSLGQVKQDRPLPYPDLRREIVADEWEANTTALIAVCNEVGLSDGSTSGSLVERVTTLEALPGGGDVVGPASAVDGNLASFDTTTGELIQDSGIAAADVSGHIASTSNPHGVTLAQVGALPASAPVRIVTADTTITSTDSGGVVVMAPSTSTDLTATLDSSLPLGFQVLIVRGAVGSGKGRVLLADNSGGTISFAPKTQIVGDSEAASLVLGVKSGSDRSWLANGPPRHSRVIVLTTDTMLDDYHSGAVIYVTTSSVDVTLTVADAVSEGWECIVWREGATYDVIIEGESTMAMSGPASATGTVTIAVDEGCVSLMRRSSSKTMAVGVIA